ncbi:MAG TPA: M20 family peptidase [Verrucomicrobia bacterium]|nr:M20 family peptidase [Verrucomicrobiota bacterium]
MIMAGRAVPARRELAHNVCPTARWGQHALPNQAILSKFMKTETPDNLESLLSRMVQFDTVNGYITGHPSPEAELSLYLEELGVAEGFKCHRLNVEDGNTAATNLLLLLECSPSNPWIIFDSHLDTVAVDGMTIDPFKGEKIGDRIQGRGSCDTKGSGAAMFWAMKEYARQSVQKHNIALLYSVDEEMGMSGIRSFTKADIQKIPGKIIGAVVGEPTMLKPVTVHNGVFRFEIETLGKAVHSSDPSLGKSAIGMMTRVIETMQTDYICRLHKEHPLTGKAQCSINLIKGGSAINIIPDQCEIQVDRRLVPGESGEEEHGKVLELLGKMKTADPGFEYRLTSRTAAPPLADQMESVILEMTQNALGRLDLSKETTGAKYGTHAGYLEQAGIPAVVIGPGDIAQAHTKDEWVSVLQLQKCTELYQEIMSG